MGSSSSVIGAPRRRMPAIATSTASPPESVPTLRSRASAGSPASRSAACARRLDVPVAADRVEVPRVDVAGLDRPQRAQRPRDPEQFGDRAIDVEGQALRQVRDLAVGE